MKLPVLALCAMMRNEEGNVDRCLSSVKDLVDFSVIVDTGSTDRSVEKARDYGAIVYPSMNMNWRKPPMFDFSHCRNESLQYCQEMGADWVLIQDLDEELQPMEASPEEFKRKLGKIPENIHCLGARIYESRPWWGVRFFRLSDGMYYENKVHNRPNLPADTYAAASDVVLCHYGYSDNAVMDKKRDRTLTLLNSRLRDDPDDHEAMFYKTLTLLGQDKVQEGVELGEKAIVRLADVLKDDPSKLKFYGKFFFIMGKAYMRLWHLTGTQYAADRATQWLTKGIELWPDDIDLNWQIATLYWMAMDTDKALEHAKKYKIALKKYEFEKHMELPAFVTAIPLDEMVIGPREVHCVGDEYDRQIDLIILEAA